MTRFDAHASLSAADRDFSARIAEAFDALQGIRRQNVRYAEHRYDPPRMDGWPTLQLDDVSGIPFLQDVLGVEFYQLRALVRAREGDTVAATCPDMPGYRTYNRDHLGFGQAHYLYAAPTDSPVKVAEACRHGESFERLVALAQQGGGLVLHPYMGIESVWALAEDLANAAGVGVGVMAPPPPVCWFANDKIHLSDLASAMLGPGAIMPSFVGDSAAALALRLVQLAHGASEVGLKMARCASAMGNAVFDARWIHEAPFGEVLDAVETFLLQKEWSHGEQVHAVAWESTDLSPSSQLWIPPLGHGEVQLDGLYEQLLEGHEKVFLGSIPARLPDVISAFMARSSLMLGTAYQHLGYVGRCSFDTIVIGDGSVRFVECNGRWGGTSTPMHLMDRVFPNGRPPYRARDYVVPSLADKPFEALAEVLGNALYDVRTGRGRFIVYNVGCMNKYGKFDVIAIGDDIEDATDALERELAGIFAAAGHRLE